MGVCAGTYAAGPCACVLVMWCVCVCVCAVVVGGGGGPVLHTDAHRCCADAHTLPPR